MSTNVYDSNSKNLAEWIEDIQLQLQWINLIKEQVDFCNNKQVLPYFEILFDIKLRGS